MNEIMKLLVFVGLVVLCVVANIGEAVLWARVRWLEDKPYKDKERPPVIRPYWVWHEEHREWWPDLHNPYLDGEWKRVRAR